MLQGLEEMLGMLGMALVCELETKIIDDEDKDDRAPLVSTITRCSVALVVSVFV